MKRLLLLHGAIGSSDQFTSLVDSIGHEFEIHLPDLEGHGNAAMRDRAFRIEHFGENVMEYLEDHNIESIDVYGYSMGGHVALFLAANHPRYLNSIFTTATKFNWDISSAERESKMLDADKILTKVPQFAAQLQKRHASDWRLVLEKSAEMMRVMPQVNPLTMNVLARIQCPVRISVGDRDQMVNLQETIDAFRAIPNCQLQVFPNTPHPLEKMNVQMLAAAI